MQPPKIDTTINKDSNINAYRSPNNVALRRHLEVNSDLVRSKQKIMIDQGTIERRKAIEKSYIYPVHANKISDIAKSHGVIIIIRELNSKTTERYKDNIISEPEQIRDLKKSKEQENQVAHEGDIIAKKMGKSSVKGKPFDVKFKSSNRLMIEAYIAVENIFSKKKDPQADYKMKKELEREDTAYEAVTFTKELKIDNKQDKYELHYYLDNEKLKYVYKKGEDFYIPIEKKTSESQETQK